MRLTLQVAGYSLVFVLIFTTVIQAQQYPCSCSCCVGPNCQVVPFANVYAYYCSTDSCLQACSAQYYQCRYTSPNGLAVAQCLTTTGGPYSCQCNCCNTGSSTCTATLVGYTTAYSCDIGSCSIACASKYPTVCVANQNGQTQGTCLGLTTSTSSTTVSTSWLGNGCSCFCCLGYNCASLSNAGNTSASQCSATACTQACQVRYPTTCPTSLSVGRTNGICTSSGTTSGSTQCQCSCCGTNGCLNYNVYTNTGCSSCSLLCQQQTQCISGNPGTYTCSDSTTLIQFTSFHWNLFLFLFSSRLFNLF